MMKARLYNMQISRYKGQKKREKKPEFSYQEIYAIPRRADCSMR